MQLGSCWRPDYLIPKITWSFKRLIDIWTNFLCPHFDYLSTIKCIIIKLTLFTATIKDAVIIFIYHHLSHTHILILKYLLLLRHNLMVNNCLSIVKVKISREWFLLCHCSILFLIKHQIISWEWTTKFLLWIIIVDNLCSLLELFIRI